jgi:hypothetical protein
MADIQLRQLVEEHPNGHRVNHDVDLEIAVSDTSGSSLGALD